MSEHTPGPWHPVRITCVKGTAFGIEAEGPYRGEIASLQDAEHIEGITGAETEANASLIAAAPDLLAACEAALIAIHCGVTEAQKRHRLKLLREAIAKAKGVRP